MSERDVQRIEYKTGSPSIDGIPHDSQATVVSATPRANLLTVRLDATREELSYNPAQLRTQTRESHVFEVETREIAQGERIRFNTYDKELGVRSGDLGTVTRLGQDTSMTVKLDSGKTAEVSPEKARQVGYGYAVGGLKDARAERVIATGAGLSPQTFQGASSKAEVPVYTNSPQHDFAPAKEMAPPQLVSHPSSTILASASDLAFLSFRIYVKRMAVEGWGMGFCRSLRLMTTNHELDVRVAHRWCDG